MLKMHNMTLIRCPVGISVEIIAVFQMKKARIDTENDKTSENFPFFEIFTHFSSNF